MSKKKTEESYGLQRYGLQEGKNKFNLTCPFCKTKLMSINELNKMRRWERKDFKRSFLFWNRRKPTAAEVKEKFPDPRPIISSMSHLAYCNSCEKIISDDDFVEANHQIEESKKAAAYIFKRASSQRLEQKIRKKEREKMKNWLEENKEYCALLYPSELQRELVLRKKQFRLHAKIEIRDEKYFRQQAKAKQAKAEIDEE